MANQAPFFTAIWASNSSSSSFRNWEMNTWRLFLESAQKGLYRCVEQFTSQIHSIRALDSCASHTVCVWDLQPKTCWDNLSQLQVLKGKSFLFFFKEKTGLLYGVINWNNSWEHQVSAPQIVHGGSEEATAHNLSPFFALGLLESEAGSTPASVLLS